MKSLLYFLAGVITGIAGVFLYEVFGKAAMPTEEKMNMVWGYMDFDELMPFEDGAYALDDTQPIRTEP